MWRSRSVCLAFCLLTAATGCTRQDTECISRIGRKVSAHARNNAGDLGTMFDLAWVSARKEPSLQERIQDRLRFDKSLAEFTFEVCVKDKEVEVKGQVKTAEQRQRAIELAESLVGVERVIDSITLREAEIPGTVVPGP
jgi:hypothetical protein